MGKRKRKIHRIQVAIRRGKYRKYSKKIDAFLREYILVNFRYRHFELTIWYMRKIKPEDLYTIKIGKQNKRGKK